MCILLILIAACLTACGTTLTNDLPSVRDDLLVLCGEKIADPLTTADQYDLARALSQAENYGQTCSKRQAELVGAVKTRQATVKAIKKNLEK